MGQRQFNNFTSLAPKALYQEDFGMDVDEEGEQEGDANDDDPNDKGFCTEMGLIIHKTFHIIEFCL